MAVGEKKGVNMKKLFKCLGIVCTIALILAVFLGIYSPEKISAADEKTVRVTTQKELNKALKDSSIDTVILRTDTYDSITISSKKAKKKKLIVDAPNSIIVNKAKFKSVVLENAEYYTEDVSGNNITVYISDFEIAEGRSVKKLTAKRVVTGYTIRKGASIKSLVYSIDENKSSYDKETRTLKLKTQVFDYEIYDYKDISYKFILDEAGRITYLEYKQPSTKRLLKTNSEYDENGNLLKVKEVYADNGEVSFSFEYKYDGNNNCIYAKEYDGYDNIEKNVEYDDNGREISYINVYSSGSIAKGTYVYDSKGRKIQSSYSYGTEDKLYYGDTTTYTYNKKGYRTKTVAEYLDGDKTIYTNKYDSAGNNYYCTMDEYDADGNVERYKYKYEYDEYGEMLAGYIQYPNSKEWLDMSELGD